VEAVLGRASSSLSLVSDATHMLLDCSGLAIGLYGELASRWQPSGSHTYGHARSEVLCTFTNATLLLVTAATISREAIGRLLFGSVPINSARVLPVAVGGLVVNILGICLFSEHHRHIGAQPCVAGCDTEASTSANMAAVLVHIAADALGSLGVIVSSLLIRYFGWTLADPICSLAISALVVVSAYPLLLQAAQVLMQRTPYMLDEGRRENCLKQISNIDGVEAVTAHTFWMLSSSFNVGTLSVSVTPDATTRQVLLQIRQVVKAHGIDSITVQIDQKMHGVDDKHHSKNSNGYQLNGNGHGARASDEKSADTQSSELEASRQHSS